MLAYSINKSEVFLSIVVSVMLSATMVLDGAEYMLVCAGQSNMDGRVPASERPERYSAMPNNIHYYQVNHMGALGATKGQLVGSKEKFGPVPEMLLTLSASRPQDTFVVVKYAVGGTALWQWVPEYVAKTGNIERKDHQ